MKKNFLQDVTPANQKRSIRDIPLPKHKETRKVTLKKEIQTPLLDEEPIFQTEELERNNHKEYNEEPFKSRDFTEKPEQPKHYKKRNSGFMKKIILVGLSIGVLIILIILFSGTKATITVEAKKSSQEITSAIPLDGTNKLATKTQINKTLTKVLPATAEQQVEKQASGRIKITNIHKETPQELVKNTRFQSPEGLIYRIKDSIVIPGYTMNGTTIIPGTLEVEVFADSAGEDYNISNTKFTIPGFEGKEQYEKITAQTATDITGGYIGMRKVVSDEAREQAQKELEAELKNQIEKIETESTEYVIVPDIKTLSYGEIQDKVEGNTVVLSLTASVDAYSFVKKDLFNFIGQNTISGASTTDQFTLTTDKLSFAINENLISITGASVITWVVDVEKIKTEFAGKTKTEGNELIDSYTFIEKANVKISPIFKTKFPTNTEKIDVVTE